MRYSFHHDCSMLVYNEQPNHLRMYECLLTNRLQGEANELF